MKGETNRGSIRRNVGEEERVGEIRREEKTCWDK